MGGHDRNGQQVNITDNPDRFAFIGWGGLLSDATAMTPNDIALIESARRLSYLHWGEVLDMVDKADTLEAKEKLRRIAIDLNHAEEAVNGLD